MTDLTEYIAGAIVGGTGVALIRYLFGKVASSYIQRDDLDKALNAHKVACSALIQVGDLKKDVKIIQKILLEVAVKNGIDVTTYKELTQ